MAKFVVLVCVALVGVLAEPPAPSNYLPPQARNSPSRSYGAPQQGYSGSGSGGFGSRSSGSHSYNSIAENQFSGSARSRNGGFRSQQPSQQYGAPNRFDDTVVTNAASRAAPARLTMANFGAPAPRDFGAPAPRSFGAPAPRNFAAPAPRDFAAQPRNQYNAPSFRQQPSSYQQPGSSYAAAARQQPSATYGAPSSEYGAPLARKMDDDLAEPANYEYNYEVQAADESGAEFGHQETREDDFARGQYHVLLPDGRMQIVEYEADEEGFRPKIRYEETGYPDAVDTRNQGPY